MVPSDPNVAINSHGGAILFENGIDSIKGENIQSIHRRQLQLMVPSRPKLKPDAITWLDQTCKMKEYYLNIETFQLCMFVMPLRHLIYGNVCNDNKYT